jgi:predicted nucleic acid-binding Zn ribbon protein
MREAAARLRLTFNDLAFHYHGSAFRTSRSRHNLTQMLFSSE